MRIVSQPRSQREGDLRHILIRHHGAELPWRSLVVHDWLREPWIDGGYSIAFLRKTVRLGRILHEGAGRLLIAGQHASFKYAGYMEGALESAQRASRRILDKCRSHPLQRNGD